MIWLFIALLTKHFIVDFLLQPKWMYANKGTFGHPGGFAHAGLHGLVTTIILLKFLDPAIACIIGWFEVFAHYLIDWAKMNINRVKGWKPDSSEYFWWLLGLDQWLHAMCYCGIVGFIFWHTCTYDARFIVDPRTCEPITYMRAA